MIIEFFGLPGSGKTTCCSLICRNFDYKNPMAFFKEKFVGKVLFHLFLLTCPFNFELLKKYNELRECFSDFKKKNRLDNTVELSKYIKYALFIYFLEKKNMNKKIVIDEGVVHYSMAIYAEFDVSFESCFKMVNILCLKNIQPVLLDIDMETCINNMKKRNRHQTAIDNLNYFELVEILEKYKEFIDLFIERADVKKVIEVDKFISEVKYFD